MSVPRSSFSTRELPADLAWSLWHEQISVLFDAKPHKSIDEGFQVSLDAWMLGEAAIGFMSSGGQYFDRSRKKIARDSMDGYLLQFYLKGQSEDRHGTHLAKPGDLYVLDMAQPLATTTTDCAQISLVLPRRSLAQHLKSPDSSHGRVISSQEPLVMLLRDTLVSFYNNIDKMTSETAEGVLRPIVDLAAMAINSQIDDDKTGSLNVMLFSSVRRHIDRNLLDPDLTVDSVMQAFGLSRRTLYRMFEAVGGFSSYVQEQRLRRSYDALRAANMRHLPISMLAAMHGFANPEVFTRAFRRLFGITPREARHLSFSEVAESRSEIPETAWSRWIVQMGR